jgi:phosphodiesterase/alkaline phosphatase D-like protein
MDRRSFLKKAGALAGVAAASPSISNVIETESFDPLKIGVLQGPTSDSVTLMTVVAHKQWTLQFLVEGADSPALVESKCIDLGFNDFVVYNLRVSELVLGVSYQLKIFDVTGTVKAERAFRALDWKQGRVRLAVASCTNHRHADPQRIMCQRLHESAPDAILFLGDLVYANDIIDTLLRQAVDPPIAYHNYVKTFLELDLYSAGQMVPVFPVWDDHDAGQDNADASHPHLAIMSRMFRTFFPVEELAPGFQPGPGMSFSLQAFDMQIIAFDQRSFATEDSLLGAEQMQWAAELIANGKSPVLIATPMLFWRYHVWGECFQRKAPEEMQTLLRLLRESKRPCLFLSGDVHYSQIEAVSPEILGFQTYELTSSALFSRPADRWGRRRSLTQLSYCGEPNFLLLDRLRCLEKSMDLRVTCITQASTVQFRRELRIEVPL